MSLNKNSVASVNSRSIFFWKVSYGQHNGFN